MPMMNIRIDDQGEQRCYWCGGKHFTQKRTFRAKATLGVGALVTAKKLQCQTCGRYNKTGRAVPFTTPANGDRTMAEKMARAREDRGV